MRVWEFDDSEKEEKKVKERPSAVAETEEEAGGDTAQPAEPADDAAEVWQCSLLCVILVLFLSCLYIV